ncbi:MAG: hypothetical protein M3P18_21790 [Actinomycetota bacterium]|nr:hypothetical protein [Actinomycetota bacterium]
MKAPTIFTRGALAHRTPDQRPTPEERPKGHLRVVPEHVPTGGLGRPWRMILFSVFTVIAIVGTGVGVYAWQHGQVIDQRAAVERALETGSALQARLTTAQNRVADLAAQVVAVQKQLTGARDRAGILRQRVADLHDQLQAATAASAAAQSQLLEVAGPPIADGRYLAFIEAIGANQTPPLIVIDVAQWFEGKAADRAARKDGIIPPGQHFPNDYYIRNASPAWRTLQIAPEPRVSMLTWHDGALGWSRVTLGRLATAFTSPNARHAGTNMSPFWVRIEGGLVSGIHQQYTP